MRRIGDQRHGTVSLPTLGKLGETVRLDWEDDDLKFVPTDIQKPTGDRDALVETFPWCQPRAANYANRARINIREVFAAPEEISRRAASGERNKRIVTILDSRVAVGSIGKGRSSSNYLNLAL